LHRKTDFRSCSYSNNNNNSKCKNSSIANNNNHTNSNKNNTSRPRPQLLLVNVLLFLVALASLEAPWAKAEVQLFDGDEGEEDPHPARHAPKKDRPQRSRSRQLRCDLSRPEWAEYREVYTTALHATSSWQNVEETSEKRLRLAEVLAERTKNVTDVLSCNVGVVAGYFLLARLVAPIEVGSLGTAGADSREAALAYRLLQLALVFIFTLRNANRIPEEAGMAWAVTEQAIIPTIMRLKKGHDSQLFRTLRSAYPISPSFRDPALRIAVVSICAYPPDHPIALTKVTPDNRDAYTRRHDYAMRLHLEPPVLGAHGLGIQHAKLATVLAYMQSGEFDWIVWLDCDSIVMNMNRTLDSIIYQYAQQVKEENEDDGGEGIDAKPICGEPRGASDVAGRWIDSFIPPEYQEEATIHIELSHSSSEGPWSTPKQIVAKAPQLGSAKGRVLEDSTLIEVNFDGGALSGRIEYEDLPISGSYASKLIWENGAVWTRHPEEIPRDPSGCRKPCVSPDSSDCNVRLDPDINLMITEEGWGLSSANWMIKTSAWSMQFLHDALTAAHVELQLFGDQDAIIHHILNQQTLRAAGSEPGSEDLRRDPLDRHAVIIPQFELNSYDSLNALTMECDTFVEGDFLITFPQCKDADGCNDVFRLAADFGKDEEALSPYTNEHHGAWWLRQEEQPRWSKYLEGSPGHGMPSSAALRVFGPRSLVREVFMREQRHRDH